MKTAIRTLLDTLDTIEVDHPEVTDTEVRDQMTSAIWKGFVEQAPRYTLPAKFGMYRRDGNKLVRVALATFINAANAELTGLQGHAAHSHAFEDETATSSRGITVAGYFGREMTQELKRQGITRLDKDVAQALALLEMYVARRKLGHPAVDHLRAIGELVKL